jgi:hypothetical protein
MTEQLPTIESLDEAAQVAGYLGWKHVERQTAMPHTTKKSIIAHARTLDKLHNRTPVDPDVEAVKRILSVWSGVPEQHIETGNRFMCTLTQYKKEIGRD